MSYLTGQQIEQYQVEALLGEGGMGVVYQAVDLSRQRQVALKVMHGNLAQQPAFRRRFSQEAEAVISFNHPAIIKIYQLGTRSEGDNDVPFMVMEYIGGGSLSAYLQQLQWSGSHIPLQQALTIVAQVADGLSYIHHRGLVHRDIKPGNILLKREGGFSGEVQQAVISDFGLAIITPSGTQNGNGDDVATNPFMGSLPYMSPEQCSNLSLDGRSDIYSLGIMLYRLATGQLPFKIEAPADVVKHLNEPPLPPALLNPDIPEAVETLILKAIAKKPAERYQSGAEMAHAARQAIATLGRGSHGQDRLAHPVTQWVDEQWIARIDVGDRVDVHQTWTSEGEHRLFVTHQWEPSQVFGLDKKTVTIGRAADNDVVLEDGAVSNQHLTLIRSESGGWLARDLGSTNGSFLDGHRLPYDEEVVWNHEQTLRIGPYFLKWQAFQSHVQARSAAPLPFGGRDGRGHTRQFDAEAAAGDVPAINDAASESKGQNGHQSNGNGHFLAAGAAAVPPPQINPANGPSRPPENVQPLAEPEEITTGDGTLGLALTPGNVGVEPGGEAIAQITILNQGTTVEDVTLRVEQRGQLSSWITVGQPSLKLMPDEAKAVAIFISPPLAGDGNTTPPEAGAHPYNIVVTTTRGERATIAGAVEVARWEDTVLDMHPRNLQEGIACRLTVHNRSNFANRYQLMGIDDSDALSFNFEQPQNVLRSDEENGYLWVTIPVGGEARVPFTVGAKKRPWLRAPSMPFPFKVRVRSEATDWTNLDGQLSVQPRISRRSLIAILLLLLLLGLLGFLVVRELEARNQQELQRVQATSDAIRATADALEATRVALQSGVDSKILEAEALEATAQALEADDPEQAENIRATASALREEAGAVQATIDALQGDLDRTEAELAQAQAEANVTPTPPPPPTDITLDNLTVPEDGGIGATVGSLGAVTGSGSSSAGSGLVDSGDPRFAVLGKGRSAAPAQQSGPRISFSLVEGDGDDDNDAFYIEGTDLKAGVAFDFETKSSYSVRVQADNGAGGTFAKPFTITIIDVNDTPTLAIRNVTVDEGDGNAVITVEMSGETQSEVTVDYETSDASGRAGTDYEETEGTLAWEPEATGPQTFEVPLIDDDLDEADEETFQVLLSNPEIAIVNSGSATVTIADDDDAPTLSVTGVTVAEGEEATVTVALNGLSSQEVVVDYQTSNGTAEDGDDYDSASGALRWDEGEDGELAFTVSTEDDDIHEEDELIKITLSGAAGALIEQGTANITITDNDEPPTLAIESVGPVQEGGEAALTVTMTGRSATEVTVKYATSDDTARSGSDYQATTGTLTWAAGESGARFIRVTVNADQIYEVPDESFKVTISNPVNATITAEQATFTITDDDKKPALSILDVSANEGDGTATVTVQMTGASSTPVNVNFTSGGGTATASEDYEPVASPPALTWLPDAENKAHEIQVNIRDDQIDEGASEQFEVSLVLDGDNATLADGIAVVTIVDDDQAGFRATPASLSVAEGEEAQVFTLRLLSQPIQDVVVPFTVNGQCFIGAEGSGSGEAILNSSNWKSGVNVSILANDEDIDDGDRPCNLQPGDPTSGDPSYEQMDAGDVPDVTVTAVDNDQAGIEVIPTTLEINEPDEVISFTVNLTSKPLDTVSIALSSDDTGECTVQPNVEIAPEEWNAGKMVQVSAVDDFVDDDDQSCTIITGDPQSGNDPLYNAFGASDVENIEATIGDDDQAGVLVSPPAVVITETAGTREATISMTLTSQPVADVTIPLSDEGNSQCDVSPASITFTSANWSQARQVTVIAVDDWLNDDDQPCDVKLGPVLAAGDLKYNNMTLSDVAVTVVDDDEPGVRLVQSGDNTTVGEDGSQDEYSIFLETEPSDDVEVMVNPGPRLDAGTGAGQPISVTFTTENWDTAQTITVSALDDAIDDDGLSNTITHTVASTDPDYNGSGATFLPARSITVSITDDDQAGIEINEDGPGTTVSEAGSTDEYEIVLTSQPTDTVEVVVTPHEELNLNNEGYGVPITITITPQQWDTAQEVMVSVEDDNIYEPNHPGRTITHTVASADPKYDSRPTADVDVAIEDDEDPPRITGEEITITEGDDGEVVTATMNVTLSALSTQQSSVNYTTLNGTAKHEEHDYDQISPAQTLTWSPGSGDTKTIELTIYGDDIDEGNTEAFYVSFDNAQNAEMAASTYTVTITDDDDAPTITIQDLTVQEGNSGWQTVDVTVVMSGMSNEDVTVGYRTRDGSAFSGSDYDDIAWHSNNTITWEAGQTGERTFEVEIKGDGTDEGIAEQFYAELRVDSGTATLADSEGTITITDNDSAEIDIVPSSLSVTEGMTETYELQLDSQPSLAISVVITPDGRLNLGDGPGVAITRELQPSDWETPEVITVTVTDNSVAQGDQDVSIQHAATSTDSNYGSVEIPFSPSATSSVTIVDNESPGLDVDLSTFNTPLLEGTSESYRLKLTSEPTATVTVNLSVNEQLDLGAGPGESITWTFTPTTWNSYKTVTVRAVADNLYDGGQHNADIVYEVISEDGGYDGLAVSPLEVTIDDGDSEPVLSVSDVTVDEAEGTATMTVTISGASAMPISVDYATTDGTATAPDDYGQTSGTVTWSASDSEPKSFTVPIVDDDIDESDETIDIEFSNVTNASMLGANRIITIVDDDPTPSISIADVSIEEGASNPTTVQITATLDGASSQQVSVDHATASGTATSLLDYAAANGTVTWDPGESGEKAITLLIVDDASNESDEYFYVNLSNPTNASISDGQGQVLIIDDDASSATLPTGGLAQRLPSGGVPLVALFAIAGLPALRRPRWWRWLPLTFLLVGLLAFQPSALAQGTPGVRVDHVETVEGAEALELNIYFTIDQALDSGASIEAASVLLDNGSTRASTRYPATVEKPPFYVALMVDTSGSMRGTLDVTRQAALDLMNAAPPEVSFAVLGFDEAIELIQPFTTDRQQVAAALDGIEISDRGTCLYDATYAAVQSLEQLSHDAPRRALVLFSDGRDEPGAGECSQNSTEQLTGLFQARSVPVPVNAVALSGGGLPDTVTLEQIAAASGGQMATRNTLPDFIESMTASMSSQWLARTRLYPEAGYRRGALLLSLAESGPLPPGPLGFRAQRSYEPPAQGDPVLIRDFAYNELTGNFLFNAALADYRQVGRLDVTVTDLLNNVQVARKSQEVILPTEQISLDAGLLEPGRRYLVEVTPYTPGGQLLRDGGSLVTAQHRFRYELPPGARQLQFAIDAVRVKDEPPRFDLRSFRVQDDVAELIVTLHLANDRDLAQVEGYLVADGENRQVAEFVTDVLPNNTVRLPLQQVPGDAYRVVLRALGADSEPLASAETVFTFRPRRNLLQRAATALRQNPILLPLALLPLALGLTGGWVYGRIVGRREGRRVLPETTPQPAVAPAPGPVQLRVLESPDEALHGAGPWLLTGSAFTIGRQGSDLTIGGDLHVSRNHARITREDAGAAGGEGRYYIEDLGSSNGTFVEGARLVAHQPTLLDLEQETHVRIGKTTQLVVGHAPAASAAAVDEAAADAAADNVFSTPENGERSTEVR